MFLIPRTYREGGGGAKMNATLGHRIHFSSCSFIIETHVLKKLVRHVG